ncbi:MAG TPA: DUF58 domain-containing protein [Planctomycetota bacterium]
MGDGETLLDPKMMRQLEQLELVVRRLNAGRTKGEKRSKRRGTGTEFADYRDYAQGDDPRHIDWNVWGRLDRLFLRVFHEEEDLRLSIHVDTSRSMSYGQPSKLLYAKRLAAALGYTALVAMDRVTLEAGSAGAVDRLRPIRGKRQLRELVGFLDGLEAGGGTDLHGGLKQMFMRNAAPGMKVVISDFLDKSGYEPALKWLLRAEDRGVVLHVLAPEEVKPELVGDLALEDCEDGELTEVSITAGLLRSYETGLKALVGGLKDYCRKRGLAYVFVPTSTPLERVVLSALRTAGVFK